jgi:2Fe-2S ferredoxin
MVSIRFVQPSGEEIFIDGAVGSSVMQAAMAADIQGINSECGGAASCGTCHAYVADDWASQIDPPAEMEAQMLEFVIEPTSNSRLTCQICISEALDGISFEVPPS